MAKKTTFYQLLIVYAILNEVHCSDVDETRIGNVQHPLGNLEKETILAILQYIP